MTSTAKRITCRAPSAPAWIASRCCLASGEVLTASRSENSDLFWASFGGMGLLGVILTATIRLKKIETTYFRQRSIRVNDLEGLLAAFEEYDHTVPVFGGHVGRVRDRRSARAQRARARRPRASRGVARDAGRGSAARFRATQADRPVRAADVDAQSFVDSRGQRADPTGSSAQIRRSVTTRGSPIRWTCWLIGTAVTVRLALPNTNS